MADLKIDLSKLDERQLRAMEAIAPEEVAAERRRRDAYTSFDEGFSDLNQAVYEIEKLLETMRQAKAVKTIKDTRILEICRRLIGRAELEGIEVKPVQL